MSSVRKFLAFVRLSAPERRLSACCLGWMWLVRLGLWMLPFPRVQRLCEYFGRLKKRLPERAATPLEIVWAVRLASRNALHATCLVQALAAQILMVRSGHSAQVRIGVAKDGKTGFRAHAWLEHEGQVLIGGIDELVEYSPLLSLDHQFVAQETRRG